MNPSPDKFKRLSLFGFLLFLQLASCSPPRPDIEKRTQFLMGTLAEISVREPDKEKARKSITLAFHEISRIEKIMSHMIPDAELSRLNDAAGKDFMAVSPELLEVVRAGIRWGDLSDGALDITIGPVARLWDFDEDKKQIPDPEKLKQAASLVHYRDIQIEDGKIRLARPGMALNLGSIAKGFAVDRAIAILKDNGIRDAIVNAGGDLMAVGTRNGKLPWIIGLQHPRQPQKTIASFGATDKAVATSGDYQRYFIRDNVRYHHVFNPADGMPARGVISSTAVGPSAMEADALATAALVLGPGKGMKLIASLKGMEGLIVEENGTKRFSGGIQSLPEFRLE